MSNEKFWVVWQPESGSPTYRHDSLESATPSEQRCNQRSAATLAKGEGK